MQDKHELYINKLDATEADTEKACLVEVQDEFLLKIRHLKDIQQELERKTQEKEEKTHEELAVKKLEQEEKQKNKLKHLTDIEGTSFMKLVDDVRKLLYTERDKERPLTPLLKNVWGEEKRQLEKCKKDNSSYLAIRGEEHYPSEIMWIGKYQSIFLKISQSVGQLIKKGQTEQVEAKPDLHLSFPTQFGLERIKMLTFNGDIREYPRFKTDFMKQFLPELASAEEAAYALRSCLGKMPYEIVKNIDNNIDEIWNRLDEKYGKASVLADLIINQIKKFRTIKDEDDKRF